MCNLVDKSIGISIGRVSVPERLEVAGSSPAASTIYRPDDKYFVTGKEKKN